MGPQPVFLPPRHRWKCRSVSASADGRVVVQDARLTRKASRSAFKPQCTLGNSFCNENPALPWECGMTWGRDVHPNHNSSPAPLREGHNFCVRLFRICGLPRCNRTGSIPAPHSARSCGPNCEEHLRHNHFFLNPPVKMVWGDGDTARCMV